MIRIISISLPMLWMFLHIFMLAWLAWLVGSHIRQNQGKGGFLFIGVCHVHISVSILGNWLFFFVLFFY